MSDIAVQIEGIGKKYLIQHNKQKGESYTALRDVLSEGAKKIITPSSWKGVGGNKEEFWALKDINLEIKKGEKIGIIGKNGAGKSTLLKILSRITAPTEGRVKINGRVSSLLEVGTGFHPELTGRENIYLNGSILGMSHTEIKKQFDEIVNFSGVEQFLDTPVKRYSSGMKTRLGFAIAAHLENDILILDEVLAVGDAEFQKKCLGKMNEVSQNLGKTIIFVSHNLQAIHGLCDRAVYIQDGVMKFSGGVSEGIKQYNEAISNQCNYVTKKSKIIERYILPELITIKNNEPIHIELGATLTEDLFDCFFDIAIFNVKNEKIIHIMNEENNNFINLYEGENTLKIIFPSLSLSRGAYNATLYLARRNKTEEIIIVEDYPLINVTNGRKESSYLPVLSPNFNLSCE